MDLRLTIPAKPPYRELAAELSVKFAEFAGVSRERAADVKAAVETALAQTTGDSIDIELVSRDGQLVLTTVPSTHRASFPLTN
jgi:hypothetical protein